MRFLIALAVVVVALHSVPAADPPHGEVEEDSWLGKTREEIVRAWGDPTRVKSDGRGGSILIYKIVFYADGDMRLGGELTYDSAGLGPSNLSGDADDRRVEYDRHEGGTVMGPSPRAPIAGKRKARFFVAADGTVYESRIRPTKWKKGYRDGR